MLREIKRGTAELVVLASSCKMGALHRSTKSPFIEQEPKAPCFTLRRSTARCTGWKSKSGFAAAGEFRSTAGTITVYRLTPSGKQKIVPLRKEWSALFAALHRLAGVSNA